MKNCHKSTNTSHRRCLLYRTGCLTPDGCCNAFRFARWQIQRRRHAIETARHSNTAREGESQAGDEVALLDGVYSVEDVLPRKQLPAKSEAVLRASFIQGGPGEPIVFRAANRHQAILDGGAPVTVWHKTPNVAAPVYHCTLPYQPLGLLVHGDRPFSSC